ncbi:uncharacterized protein isoform X1 [Musca autumnalis]|uniref:uncharacterized protein n=2 Tax=Musca autumnalis TaxID=221902 RepID=UPI003CF5BB71
MRSRRNSSTRELYQCVICDRSHALRFCPEFVLMRVEDRRKVVRDNDYCMNCLARSHQVRRCHSKVVCKKCGSQHHSMLHPEPSSTAIVRHEDSQELSRATIHERVVPPNSPSRHRRQTRSGHQPRQQHRPRQRQNCQQQHHRSKRQQQKRHRQQPKREQTQRQQSQPQHHPRSSGRQQNYRHHNPQPNRPQNNHQQRPRNNRQAHQSQSRNMQLKAPRSSVLMPDQLVLSQAIKSLAEVMCVASSVAQVQGRRHGQI